MRPIGLLLAINTLVSVVIEIAVLGWAARRLLGIAFSITRLVLAGILALIVLYPIVEGLLGPDWQQLIRERPQAGLWMSALGLAASLLCAMVFLALAEVFVPNGTVPGPVALFPAPGRATAATCR